MSAGKRDLAIVNVKRGWWCHRWDRLDTCFATLVAVGLVAVIGTSVAKAYAAPRDVVPAAVVPAEVVPVEWYDSLMEPMPHALDSTGWANAEVVEMVGRALEATMNPLSSGTWRPGFEAHLLLKGFTDVQIRAAVLRAYAVISIEVADAVFAELGKPGP